MDVTVSTSEVENSAASSRSRRVHKRLALRVWCSPDEKAEIERLAATTNLSVSCFLRTLGLAHEPKSKLDVNAVRELARLSGDLGRMGGLLKMYLTNDERLLRAHNPQDLARIMEGLIRRIDLTQHELLTRVREL